MALYVRTKLNADYEWHVGKNYNFLFGAADKVVYMSADGHELQFIEKNFKNLPSTTGRVVTWKGQLADFIHTNLYSLPTISKV